MAVLDFDAEVLRSDVPVLVGFSATWCHSCHAMERTLEEIIREQAGKLKVVELNVDDSPAVATRFRVQTLPTLILFLQGQPVGRLTGDISQERLMMWLENYKEGRHD